MIKNYANYITVPSLDLNVTFNDKQSNFVLDTGVYKTAYFYIENDRVGFFLTILNFIL